MGSGGTSLRSRQADNASPTPSDDSDTDISLGTHSPVPSSLSLQHSPGSTSGGGNDDRLMHGKFAHRNTAGCVSFDPSAVASDTEA